MNRFFIDSKNIDDEVVQIEGKDYKHISQALRLQPGDKVIICTGDGIDYIVELRKFYNNENLCIGRIISKKRNQNEPQVNISLAQAIPKDRNMELVAEKGTEMGIKNLIPLDTKRTVVKLKGNKKSSSPLSSTSLARDSLPSSSSFSANCPYRLRALPYIRR